MKVFFDRRYGVHTEDKVEAESLGINATDCCRYMPYKRCSLSRILPYREVTIRSAAKYSSDSSSGCSTRLIVTHG